MKSVLHELHMAIPSVPTADVDSIAIKTFLTFICESYNENNHKMNQKRFSFYIYNWLYGLQALELWSIALLSILFEFINVLITNSW